MHYAYITTIQVSPHPDPETTNIQIGTVLGQTVIVGKDVQSGDLGVFFRDGTAVSPEVCRLNNLYSKTEFNQDPVKGYLEPSGRVRVLKLRNVYSEGLWLPIKCLAHTGCTFTDGQIIEEAINGFQICSKYEPPETRAAKEKRAKTITVPKYRALDFLQHYDTPQAGWVVRNAFNSGLPTRFFKSEKQHGTSGRSYFGRIEETLPDPWWYKPVNYVRSLFGYLPLPHKKRVYQGNCYGTRNTVVYCNQDDYRSAAHYNIKTQLYEPVKAYIEKLTGEKVHQLTFYYELCGYTDNGGYIQPPFSLDPKHRLYPKYGHRIVFAYGMNAKAPQTRVSIYRITYSTSIRQAPKELPVEEMMILHDRYPSEEVWDDQVLEFVNWTEITASTEAEIMAELQKDTRGHSSFDNSHIKEGMIVRAENSAGTKVGKLKSWDFCELEGIRPWVDPEDVE